MRKMKRSAASSSTAACVVCLLGLAFSGVEGCPLLVPRCRHLDQKKRLRPASDRRELIRGVTKLWIMKEPVGTTMHSMNSASFTVAYLLSSNILPVRTRRP